MRIKAAVIALVLSASLVAPAAAGPFEDGFAASQRGDYATALKLWRPLAEQGIAAAQHRASQSYGMPDSTVTFQTLSPRQQRHRSVNA